MAGFKEGALQLKKRNTTLPSDPGTVKLYIDNNSKLYTVDEFGTSAYVDTNTSGTSGTSGVGYTLITSGNNLIITTSGINQIIDLKETGVVSGGYTKIIVDTYGRIISGGYISASDIPLLPATKIGSGIIDDTEFSYLDGVSANIQTQLNILKQNAISGAGAGTPNRIVKFITSSNMSDSTITDDGMLVTFSTPISSNSNISANSFVGLASRATSAYQSDILKTGRTFSISGSVTSNLVSFDGSNNVVLSATISSGIDAVKIGSGNITNAEFEYLNNVSANIQTQLSNLSANETVLNNKFNSYLPLSGGTMTGTLNVPSVSANSIIVGNVSNSEIQHLDGVSAGIQNQLVYLSANKVDKITTITTTSGLTGGGDLSTNRTIGLIAVGTSGTYTKVTTNAYGQVINGTTLVSADIPTIPPSKILEDANDRFVSDVQINSWTSTSSTVQSNSANWNTAFTSAHFHTNKATLDLINQSLNTSANISANSFVGLATRATSAYQSDILKTGRTISLNGELSSTAPLFDGSQNIIISATILSGINASKIADGSISNTEFQYLNNVSANIQTQLSNLSGIDNTKIDKTAVQPFLGIYRNPLTLEYQSTMSYNPTTRIVTLNSPTSAYPRNLYGTPTIISGSLGAHSNVTDSYFYYLDSSGTLQITNTPWNLLTDCPIALVFYNATQVSGMLFEERHSHDRNPEAHKQQHLSIGTFCNPYPSLGGYSLTPAVPTSANNIYTVSDFNIYDEDIRVEVSGFTSASTKQVFYQSGANHEWAFDGNDPYGYAYGTFIKYNQFTGATYTLTDLANNEYVNYYVFGVTTISGSHLITIPSTNKYASLPSAQAEKFADVLNATSIPLQEWVILFKFTYRTNNAYTTPGKCRIENVESYEDSRTGTTLAGTGISQTFADSTYLRLDGTNDPILGDITINANLSAINISATTITVGNISNTEFQFLDNISANIQTQLTTLSANKADKTITITAGTMLSGGGDLTTNRTISHQTVGTSGTYSNIVTNSTGHVTSARALISADIPTLPATKIGTGIIDDTEFNYLNGVSANIQTQLNNIANNKFTSAISILATTNQTFIINHNLGYLRPLIKIVDETNDQEILVSPNYISTTQLSFTINSRISRTAIVIVMI